MRRLLSRISPLALIFSLFFGFLSLRGSAQGFATQSKASDIDVFLGYLNTDPNYGPDRNSGFTVGADYTRYFHLPVAPSFQFRVNDASGAYATEKSYSAGFKVELNVIRRIHPYGDFLIGYGAIHYVVPPTPGYTEDNAIIPTYGGGVDLDLVPNFLARIDYQGQSWSFDNKNKISPGMFSIGLVYRIPFKPHTTQEYARR